MASRISSSSKHRIKSVGVVKRFNYVRIAFSRRENASLSFLVDHTFELGAECLHGETSNNPLYQLAEEHQLIDIDDRKIN